MKTSDRPVAFLPEHVDVHDAYALSVWARYFNVSEQCVIDAVQSVGDDPNQISRHLEHAHAGSV